MCSNCKSHFNHINLFLIFILYHIRIIYNIY
nr:MAG TPA: hypothetical protein [Caudoviricetes sp.]